MKSVRMIVLIDGLNKTHITHITHPSNGNTKSMDEDKAQNVEG